MYQGRIKLHRSSQDNVLYFSEPFTKRQARQDMILLTNHKDGVIVVRGNIIEVKRGQLGYSEDTISKRWQWSRNKTRRFLNYLETIQQIEQHKSKVKSVITIKNYDKFQGNDTTEGTTDGHQTIQQTDTNKNDNNEKNDNNIIITKSNTEPRSDINNLIEKLKEKTDALGLAYDNEKERQFGKHILTAKEFGTFCDKLNMDRVTFSLAVLEASVKIGYWKGPATGPKKIYQHYAEIYNQTAQKSQSKSNVLVI